MPVELDLTGCCYVCYSPLVDSGKADSPGKICPNDRSCNGCVPRLQISDATTARELLASLGEDLRLKYDLDICGVQLDTGAELFCEEAQAFRWQREKWQPINPPDRRSALEWLIGHEGPAIQLTFRNPRPPGTLTTVPVRRPSHAERRQQPAVEALPDSSVIFLPVLDSPVLRVDPADGGAGLCSFRELVDRYREELSERDIEMYWRNKCRVQSTGVAEGARRKGKGVKGKGADSKGATPGYPDPLQNGAAPKKGARSGKGISFSSDVLAQEAPPVSADVLQADGDHAEGGRRPKGKGKDRASVEANGHGPGEGESLRSKGKGKGDVVEVNGHPDGEAPRPKGKGKSVAGSDSNDPMEEEAPRRKGKSKGTRPEEDAVAEAQAAEEPPRRKGKGKSAPEEVAVETPVEDAPRRKGKGKGGAVQEQPDEAQGEDVPRRKGKGKGSATKESSFDLSAWLASLEPAGMLGEYQEAFASRYSSLEEIKSAYQAGDSNQFFTDIGVRKLGHKRLLQKALSE